jgi:hypothetical protein
MFFYLQQLFQPCLLSLWHFGFFPTLHACRLRNTMTTLEGAAATLDVPSTPSLCPSLAAQALRPFLFALQPCHFAACFLKAAPGTRGVILYAKEVETCFSFLI